MKDVLGRLPSTRILVVGDLMVDGYLWGEVNRVSPEAPVPVVRVAREEQRLGGGANVVHNLTQLGCQVGVCGVVGDDHMGAKVREMLMAQGTDCSGVFTDSSRPTIEKTRILAQNQQILRIDREEAQPISEDTAAKVRAFLEGAVTNYDGVIVSDYGKGLITNTLMDALRDACRRVGREIVVDPKGTDYTKYKGVTCITPNEHEAAQATHSPLGDDRQTRQAGGKLMKELDLKRICITRGAKGVLAMTGSEERLLPTKAQEVYDVTGAGDTFISVFGALSFAGVEFFDCVEVANLAAGVVVSKVGTATVTPHEILAAAEDSPKYYTSVEIEAVAQALRANGKRIAFTNGCFDLLHAGHVQYLQASRNTADVLIVGLNSDDSVRRLKGPERPVIGEEDRAHLLGALSCVDYVVVFEEDTPLELIRRVRPHVLTKGADYTVDTVVGHDLISEWGGEVRLIPLAENRSTTNLIEKIAGGKA